MEKARQYLTLVHDRKECSRCTGLVNPNRWEGGEFDSNDLGPWTRWQGNLDALLMIVGQDWGDTAYFSDNQGGEKIGNPTNAALVELLLSIGIVIGPPHD